MSSRLRNRDRRGTCQCPETLLHSYLEFIRDCSGYRSIQCTNQGAPSWAFRIANANAHVWVCVRLSFQQSAELLSHRRQYRYKDDHLPPYRKTFVKKRESLVLREIKEQFTIFQSHQVLFNVLMSENAAFLSHLESSPLLGTQQVFNKCL